MQQKTKSPVLMLFVNCAKNKCGIPHCGCKYFIENMEMKDEAALGS